VSASVPRLPSKIISGGQTGVDRAALDVAIELGIPHGGSCPRGRLAEDGPIPAKYQLTEHASPSYDDRTRQNVADSDATLILCDTAQEGTSALRGGTKLTFSESGRQRRPCLVVQLGDEPSATGIAAARSWLAEHRIATLNVAGPRESQSPGVGQRTTIFLRALLAGPG
jgi:hypothetical protein